MTDQIQAFLSYAHADQDVADRIGSRLSEAGMRVWTDAVVNPGKNWVSAIEFGIKESDVIVVLVGADFLASSNALYELGYAASEQRSRGVRILPVVLPGGDQIVPAFLRRFQILDARGMAKEDLADKVAELTAKIATTASEETPA